MKGLKKQWNLGAVLVMVGLTLVALGVILSQETPAYKEAKDFMTAIDGVAGAEFELVEDASGDDAVSKRWAGRIDGFGGRFAFDLGEVVSEESTPYRVCFYYHLDPDLDAVWPEEITVVALDLVGDTWQQDVYYFSNNVGTLWWRGFVPISEAQFRALAETGFVIAPE